MPINFTVTWDDLTNDVDDTTSDIGEAPVIGWMYFTTQIADGAVILAAGHTPRPAGFQPRTFSGYLDSDGQLKNKPGGSVGARLWANDPIFGLTRLQYYVTASLSDALGRAINFQPFAFDAPSTDSTVNLTQVMPLPGQDFSRGPNAYDMTGLSINGSNQFVFEREDGFTLPPVTAGAVVDITPARGRAVAFAIALGR